MIAYLKGTLIQRWDKYCAVLTPGGVGYKLMLPAVTFAQLPPEGAEVEFHTSLVAREDSMELFGFATFAEKQMFETLISISKIGARTALAVLSVFDPEELRRIVAEGDFRHLTKVPGIGQKSAQHIFLELKYKLKETKGAPIAAGKPARQPSVFNDALDALANLGYSEDECVDILKDILQAEPDLDAGGAIRLCLKALAKGKL